MALRLSGDLQKYKQENEALQMENEYLRQSKLALVKATANEIERLRRFIALLANAMRGKGFTVQNMKEIARSASYNNDSRKKRNNYKSSNPAPMKQKSDWKWKQKEMQSEKAKNSNTTVTKRSNQNKNSVSKPVSLLDPATDSKESKPMSLKERMSALESKQKESSSVNSKMDAMKAERNLHKVKVSTTSKDTIAGLFADKIEKQKKSSAAMSMTSSKGKILKEALKNPEPEKAAEIIQELGLFAAMEKKPDFRKNKPESEESKSEESPKLEVLNLNNNVMMKKMSETEKANMENLICDSLIKNTDLKQVQMCNADINDKFLKKILDKLANNRDSHAVKELWLESNPIGDEGMKYLAEFMASDDRIEIVKLYNNKKTISTQVLNELLDGLKANETIVKFVFDGFRFQHQKDKKEKYLRRNAEIARRKRNEERKRLKALQNQ